MKLIHGELTAMVLSTLADDGPQTLQDLATQLGLPALQIGAVMHRLRQATPKREKRVHILRWEYEQVGQKRYPRALYALGDAPDRKKPRPESRDPEWQRRWREKVKNSRRFVASVFELANVDDLIARRRMRDRGNVLRNTRPSKAAA